MQGDELVQSDLCDDKPFHDKFDLRCTNDLGSSNTPLFIAFRLHVGSIRTRESVHCLEHGKLSLLSIKQTIQTNNNGNFLTLKPNSSTAH